MARIKKDKDSWHASGIVVRDKKHDKSFDGHEGRRPNKKKKKNTKKWCKGIEGRKHILVWEVSKWERGFCHRFNKPVRYKQAVCNICHKVIKGWVGNQKLWKQDPNELYNKG